VLLTSGVRPEQICKATRCVIPLFWLFLCSNIRCDQNDQPNAGPSSSGSRDTILDVRRIQITPLNSIRPPKRLYNDSVPDSEDKEMKRVKVQHKNEPNVEAFNGNVKHETKVNKFNMLISPLRSTMASLPDRNLRTSCPQKWRRHNSTVITFPRTQPSPPYRPSKPSGYLTG
jgi:hypothetical protein